MRLSDAADPALGSLPPVLDRGAEMLKEAAPVASDLRDGGGGLRGVAGAAKLRDELAGKRVAIPLTGGNVTEDQIRDWLY